MTTSPLGRFKTAAFVVSEGVDVLCCFDDSYAAPLKWIAECDKVPENVDVRNPREKDEVAEVVCWVVIFLRQKFL